MSRAKVFVWRANIVLTTCHRWDQISFSKNGRPVAACDNRIKLYPRPLYYLSDTMYDIVIANKCETCNRLTTWM